MDGEIDVILPCPAVGDAVARQCPRVFHAQGGPQYFAVVVVETVVEIDDELLGLAFWVRVFVDAAVRGGGELHEDVVVAEAHLVVARRGLLGLVAEARAVAAVGVVGGAGVELHLAGEGHQQDVAHIGVAGAAEVGVTETHDGLVAVLVAGAVVIDTRLVAAVDVVGDGVRVGTHLHAPEGVARARESVPHAVGPDHRVNILGIIALRGCGHHGEEDYGG